MDESVAAVLVALITALVGPLAITWIQRISKRTAKLPTELPGQVDREEHLVVGRLRLVEVSLELLHQKVDIILEQDQFRMLLNRLEGKK